MLRSSSSFSHMSQKTGKDYFGNWEFNNAPTRREDSQSAVEPLDRSRLVPPDNLIPSLDANNRVTLPPPFESQRTPESEDSHHRSKTGESALSPSSTSSSSSPTPKLKILTDLRPGSFSISSQTSTPYSDTLLSNHDTTPSPARQSNLEEPSPPPRRRSNSEPPKKYLSAVSRNPHGENDPSVLFQSLQPQSTSIHSARTPVTPGITLSRSSSRKKVDAFVAHNPFVSHSHVHGVEKSDKQDLTFDDILTPGPHSNPFGTNMFTSDTEDVRDGLVHHPTRSVPPIFSHGSYG